MQPVKFFSAENFKALFIDFATSLEVYALKNMPVVVVLLLVTLFLANVVGSPYSEELPEGALALLKALLHGSSTVTLVFMLGLIINAATTMLFKWWDRRQRKTEDTSTDADAR